MVKLDEFERHTMISVLEWRTRFSYEKWMAKITVNYKQIFLGYFPTAEEANEVVTKARKRYMPFSME